MKQQLYNIRKAEKATMRTVGYLSQNKRRWLPLNSKHKRAKLTEEGADICVKSHADDQYYYYFKIWAI